MGTKMAYIAYNSKNVIDSVLSQSVSKIIRDNLYEMASKIYAIKPIDRYLVVATGDSLVFFENAFNPNNVRYEDAGVLVNT
jgi:hypothetical protein